MGPSRTAPLALILVFFASAPAAAQKDLPPNPHSEMYKNPGCDRCHNYYGGSLDPHEFIVPIPEGCWECHTKKMLGNSHPIGIDPRYSDVPVEIPDDLPLEDGKLSCGTCHQPHRDHLAKIKAFAEQKVAFRQEVNQREVIWYSTLFLRKSDPKRGFEPLCMACHTDF